MRRNNFPKSVRLLKSSDFERVFDQRCSRADGMLIVYAAASEAEQPRLGMVVSRKVGKAVARNRWKRLIREAFRLVQHQLPRHVDLIVLPQRGARPDLGRLQSSLRTLANKARPHFDVRCEM